MRLGFKVGLGLGAGLGDAVGGRTNRGVCVGKLFGAVAVLSIGMRTFETVGVAGAPHNPAFAAHALNSALSIVVCIMRWKVFIARRDYTRLDTAFVKIGYKTYLEISLTGLRPPNASTTWPLRVNQPSYFTSLPLAM